VSMCRVSALTGSDHEVVFRSRGVGTLVLTVDAELHRVLTEKVFPRQADVLTIERWIGGGQRLS